MDIHFLSLTVCFEPPFWVGVFERIERGARSASRVTFGAEPKDCEVWDFVLKHDCQLKISPSIAVGHSTGGGQSQTGTANAAQADRPRPDRHKIAAGFAAPARCIQTGAENVHAGAAGDRKTAPFRAAAAETKGNAPGALISGAFSLLRCALNFRRSGCRGR